MINEDNLFIRYILGKPRHRHRRSSAFYNAIDEGKKERIAGKVAWRWKKEHEEEKAERNQDDCLRKMRRERGDVENIRNAPVARGKEIKFGYEWQ